MWTPSWSTKNRDTVYCFSTPSPVTPSVSRIPPAFHLSNDQVLRDAKAWFAGSNVHGGQQCDIVSGSRRRRGDRQGGRGARNAGRRAGGGWWWWGGTGRGRRALMHSHLRHRGYRYIDPDNRAFFAWHDAIESLGVYEVQQCLRCLKMERLEYIVDLVMGFRFLRDEQNPFANECSRTVEIHVCFATVGVSTIAKKGF